MSKTAKRFIKENEESLERAAKLFDTFHARESEEIIFANHRWPAPHKQVRVGDARRIGYRSDKWMERDPETGERPTRDYIHAHKRPLPRIVMERPTKKQAGEDPDSLTLYHQAAEHEPVPFPDPPVFTVLGKALDLEYERPDASGAYRVGNVDWKERADGTLRTTDELPILAVHREIFPDEEDDDFQYEKDTLVIYFEGSPNPPLLIEGDLIRVEAGGIHD